MYDCIHLTDLTKLGILRLSWKVCLFQSINIEANRGKIAPVEPVYALDRHSGSTCSRRPFVLLCLICIMLLQLLLYIYILYEWEALYVCGYAITFVGEFAHRILLKMHGIF